MSNIKSELHNRIMRRVYALYVWRLSTRPQTLTLVGFIISLVLIYLSVSVNDVISNMPTPASLSEFISFWQSAIVETERLVQFALLSAIAFGLVAISSLTKTLRTREASFQ